MTLAPEVMSVSLPSDQYRQYRSMRFFSSLDGLRCASILGVIWHHTAPGWAWLPASRRGYLGVDMFFVISGFLIVTLLLREQDRCGSISLNKFYARRFLRIFPIYYGLIAALTLAFMFVMPGSNFAPSFFRDLPYYVTYTSNWVTGLEILAISWSLAAEEQFYIIWPLIQKALRGWWLMLLLVGFIIVNQLVNFRLADDVLDQWFGVRQEDLAMLQVTFTPICLGVLLAHALHAETFFKRAAGLLGRSWSPIVMLAVLLLACNSPGNDIAGWPRLVIQLSMALLLASCVMREDHALRPILNFAPIARLGVISYGMYLYHKLTMHVASTGLEKTGIDLPGALFIVCLALTVAVSEVSYRFYEVPFLNLKRRFARAPIAAAGPHAGDAIVPSAGAAEPLAAPPRR